MTVAIGVELSTDTDMAAVAVAGAEGGKYLARVMFYGSPDDVVAECARLYGELDNCGVFCDPQPNAGIVDGLRAAGCWLHLMEGTDVSASQWQFVTEVRARRVKAEDHPALRAAMRAADSRPHLLRFAFERRRVQVDQSPLAAAADALWGFRKNEAVSEPGAWVV